MREDWRPACASVWFCGCVAVRVGRLEGVDHFQDLGMKPDDPGAEPRRFALDDLIVDTATHQVYRSGIALNVPRLSFQFLMALARAAPAVVTTEQLADQVWADRVIGNETITQRVKLLRKALADDAAEPRYVGLVRGEGYRLLVDVVLLDSSGSAIGSPPRRRLGWSKAAALLALATVVAGGAFWLARRDLDAPRAPAPGSPRLAVLPFLNLSNEPDQEYFVDGLTEEVINELSHLPGLRVAGRTSSFAFKGRTPAFAEVGATLGVDHVLEGSVRREGQALRVTTQLINVPDGFHLWSATYALELDDPFTVQEQIAGSVAEALRIELGAPPPDGLRHPESTRAYTHFLRGQAMFWNQTPESVEHAIDEYRKALALEPGILSAWISLGYAYGGRSRDPNLTESALRDMASAAQHAVSLAPDAWQAHALHAWVRMSRHEFLAAEASMDRALALRERYPNAQDGVDCPVACYYQQIGRVSEAIAEARRVQQYDPLSVSASPAPLLYLLGRREEAMAAYEEFQELTSQPFERFLFDFWLSLERNDPEEMNRRLEGTAVEGLWGQREPMLAALQSVHRANPVLPRGYRASFAAYASIHGDDALAVDLLRDEYLPEGFGAYFLLWQPALRSVRQTRGFVDFLNELGLVDMWRQTGRWGDYCQDAGDGTVTCQ